MKINIVCYIIGVVIPILTVSVVSVYHKNKWVEKDGAKDE